MKTLIKTTIACIAVAVSVTASAAVDYRGFGKLRSNHLVPALSRIMIDGKPVRAEDASTNDYLKVGYKMVDRTKPEPSDIFHEVVLVKWYEEGDWIKGMYVEQRIKRVIYIYNVNTIITECALIQKWAAVKEALDGLQMLEAFVSAGTIDTDYPGFDELVNAACKAAGITEAEKNAILKKALVRTRKV